MTRMFGGVKVRPKKNVETVKHCPGTIRLRGYFAATGTTQFGVTTRIAFILHKFFWNEKSRQI